ncbi:MAG: glycoside hydrolase family 13 protein [Clostridia bacterium]|nr:glycoside hydrolase family 13 protein [Clostridia bacterium]
MQFFVPYDSRNEAYKTPFGSVPEGQSVHFSVHMPRSMGCTGVYLVLREDNGEEIFYKLYWRSTDGVTEWWECDYTPAEAGLYWYYFEYSVSWGNGRIYRSEGGKGCFSGACDPWQLTVYDREFQTPDKIKGGVIYQIFPDRFYCSGAKKENIPYGRVLREDRENLPYWKPDSRGRILNNDYFCGDLNGIEEKLPYLHSLGVTCIYLNPIFEAHSNHRYDTADYMAIDPLLGTKDDFISLCKAAKALGVSVIFDGVFSHTGDDSIYFNKYKRYGSGGAYNDEDSPYRSWYTFGKTRDEYASWWGIDILPEVNENDKFFSVFITGEGGVIDTWLEAGADGVRLDVADELPDAFIDKVRMIVKKNGNDRYLLGEVWEDASNKFSWGARRRYLLGDQLDSVMNYPFRDAIISFVKNADAGMFMNKIMDIVENYPAPALHTAMNHLGTHDTVRILTALSDVEVESLDRDRQAEIRLTPHQRETAITRLKAAAVLQYTLPGVPSLYYGDEAGLEGGKDPFNRRFYPWGREDTALIEFFRKLGAMRADYTVFREGSFLPLSDQLGCAAYLRKAGDSAVVVISNMNGHAIDYRVNYPHAALKPILFCDVTARGELHLDGVTTAVAEIIV